jgi:hypothetical protein
LCVQPLSPPNISAQGWDGSYRDWSLIIITSHSPGLLGMWMKSLFKSVHVDREVLLLLWWLSIYLLWRYFRLFTKAKGILRSPSFKPLYEIILSSLSRNPSRQNPVHLATGLGRPVDVSLWIADLWTLF